MTLDSLLNIRERIQRAIVTMETKSHIGFHNSFCIDSVIHTYNVYGLKSPEQLNDELLNIFIWLWSTKDYLKESYKSLNLRPETIEELVNNNFSLQLISDIANRAKHSYLSVSRSGKYAQLSKVGFVVPQTAISYISFEACKVSTNINSTKDIELTARIECRAGHDISDAFTIIQSGLEIWETEIEKITSISNH